MQEISSAAGALFCNPIICQNFVFVCHSLQKCMRRKIWKSKNRVREEGGFKSMQRVSPLLFTNSTITNELRSPGSRKRLSFPRVFLFLAVFSFLCCCMSQCVRNHIPMPCHHLQRKPASSDSHGWPSRRPCSPQVHTSTPRSTRRAPATTLDHFQTRPTAPTSPWSR